MISNELLEQKILDEAIHGRLVKNDLTLEPIDVEEVKEDIPFELPNNWRWTELRNICKLSNGIKVSNVYLPYLEVKYLRGKSEAVYKNKGILASEGDYIILVDGENSGEVFKIQEVGILGSTFKILNLNCYMAEEFILFLLKYNQLVLKNNKTGAAIPHLNKKLFSSILVPVPPLEEQKRIVDKIEELFNLIDRKEHNDKEKERLKLLLKDKILDEAIHGRLVKNDLSLEPTNIEETKDNVPFEIPNNWKWCHINRLSKITMGQSPKGNSINNISGIEFHQGKKLFGDIMLRLSQEYTNNPTKIIDEDSILMSVRAPVGNINLINRKICIGRGLCAFTPNDTINIKYLFYFFKYNYKYINSLATGTTFLSINSKDINKIIIPLPPLEEQKRIVEKVENLFALIDKL